MSSSRILHASEGPIINMISALGDSTKDFKSNWPSTAIFETISANIDGDGLAPSVKQSIELALESSNQICCSCVGNCATNDDCECLKMARLMEETLGGEVLEQGKPIHNPATSEKTIYWEKPRFVCGPRCSCRGECSLNALQNIEKDQTEKFKIRRSDNKGFCLFAKFDVEAGTPIASFNGEMVGSREIKKDMDVHQYSLQVIAKDDPFWKILNKCKSMDQEYRKQLKKAYRTPMFINPLKKGNFARMVNHSCDPNMEILRVFQGGVSPADVRVIFVATRTIISGEELTFHYGDSYVKEHLGTCLCDKCELDRSSRKRKRDDSSGVFENQAKKSRH